MYTFAAMRGKSFPLVLAGFPRNLLFELRPFQVVQTANQVLMLYMFEKRWRVIWTDGCTRSRGSAATNYRSTCCRPVRTSWR